MPSEISQGTLGHEHYVLASAAQVKDFQLRYRRYNIKQGLRFWMFLGLAWNLTLAGRRASPRHLRATRTPIAAWCVAFRFGCSGLRLVQVDSHPCYCDVKVKFLVWTALSLLIFEICYCDCSLAPGPAQLNPGYSQHGTASSWAEIYHFLTQFHS